MTANLASHSRRASYETPDLDGAACRGHDPEVWFDEAARFAKRVCNGYEDVPGCPVRAACLAGALERREEYGVFGGLDAMERKALLKKADA